VFHQNILVKYTKRFFTVQQAQTMTIRNCTASELKGNEVDSNFLKQKQLF